MRLLPLFLFLGAAKATSCDPKKYCGCTNDSLCQEGGYACSCSGSTYCQGSPLDSLAKPRDTCEVLCTANPGMFVQCNSGCLSTDPCGGPVPSPAPTPAPLPPTPAPAMPTGCTVKGPSYTIDGGSQLPGAPWPYSGVKDAAACASLCKADLKCTTFHYYGVSDHGYGDCYVHAGGEVKGPVEDGRDRYAGTCNNPGPSTLPISGITWSYYMCSRSSGTLAQALAPGDTQQGGSFKCASGGTDILSCSLSAGGSLTVRLNNRDPGPAVTSGCSKMLAIGTDYYAQCCFPGQELAV